MFLYFLALLSDFISTLGMKPSIFLILDSLLSGCSLKLTNYDLYPLCFIDALLIPLDLRLNLFKIPLNLLLNFLVKGTFQSPSIKWLKIDISSAVDLIDLKHFFSFLNSFLYCFISSFLEKLLLLSHYSFVSYMLWWFIYLFYIHPQILSILLLLFTIKVHTCEPKVHLKFFNLKLKYCKHSQ